MKILDGKKLSEEILDDLARKIKSRHLKLRLAVILVGSNSVSRVFIEKKKEACQRVGIGFNFYQFREKTGAKELKKAIEKISRNPQNSGVVIQLPLPKHLNVQEVLNLLPPEKDVDVLSELNLGKFSQGTLNILPPTVGGISHLLNKYRINVKGKNTVVVGAGRLVGYPLALWLLKEKATVLVLNEFTKDASSFIRKADILVSGVGKPNLIRGDMVKSGAVVIDAGTTVEGGKLVGDVDFKSVSKKSSYITPVPGGVGPLTVACLLENLVKLNK
ncbi:MAG: bifunctional 5,10-methylenetetrahydrofolate dehydrogenase/5,10-methenyltetrahydrofolate cyclohydrolase [bacterium]|nr:bifunctional 5,10-methylenetetrahydrofolate dehydrogenase/5,10-methenyltetrahydrofolate cyclohydrolase [bacterium]